MWQGPAPQELGFGREDLLRKRTSIWLGALLGGLTSLPLVALFYLGEQLAGLPFLPFSLFDWVARALPGNLITLGIDGMVQVIGLLNVGPTSAVAKAMEQLMGLVMFVGGAVVLATTTPGSGAGPATPMPEPAATATMRDRLPPAPGTRMELTPTDDLYRIDINTRPPVIDGASWQMEVAGLFDDARPLTLDDLTAYPPVVQPITLSCISNRIARDLISTGNWIGVRLRDVLKDLGLRPEAGALYVEAENTPHPDGATGYHGVEARV